MRLLHRLPIPLARFLMRRGARAIALYNRTFHPHVRGVGVFVRHGERLLLVRSTYQSWWGLPGGRVDRGEEARTAAARELREEAGIDVSPGELSPLGELDLAHSNIHDHVSFYALRCEREPIVRCDGVEIAELRWASAQELRELRLWPPLREWLARNGARP